MDENKKQKEKIVKIAIILLKTKNVRSEQSIYSFQECDDMFVYSKWNGWVIFVLLDVSLLQLGIPDMCKFSGMISQQIPRLM